MSTRLAIIMSLPRPHAIGCDAAGDLKHPTVKKSTNNDPARPPVTAGIAGEFGIFSLKKLNNRLTIHESAATMRLGIDIGGTKIEAAALDDDGAIRLRRRLPTPAGDYEGIIATVKSLVADAEAALGPAQSIGLGIPGMVSPATGLVKNANSTCLIGRAFDRDLAAALGRPVRLANDANCFALSEAVDGAAAGAAVMFGVILGTGVGGGIVVDRKVLTGPNAIAGEWGHSPLPWPRDHERPGTLCYCGKHGCLETFLSGAGLARAYAARGGNTIEASAIAARAAAGEAAAAAALADYADRLAGGLAT